MGEKEIVLLNLPVLAMIVVFHFRAAKLFGSKGLFLSGIAWVCNALYLFVAFLDLIRGAELHTFASLISPFFWVSLSTLATALFFISYSVTRSAFPSKFDFAFLSILAVSVVLLVKSADTVSTFIFMLLVAPSIFTSAYSLLRLARLYRRVENRTLKTVDLIDGKDHRVTSLLYVSTVIYAGTQFFYFANHQSIASSVGIPFENIALVLALVSKFGILLGVQEFFIKHARQISDVKSDARTKEESLGITIHELGTPLIALNKEIEKDIRVTPESKKARLNVYHQLNNRAIAITEASRFIHFAEEGKPQEHESVNINTLCEIAKHTVKTSRTEDVGYTIQYGANCFVNCNMGEIIGVLINFLRNSYDAFPEAVGHIELRTQVIKAESDISTDLVRLEILDDGEGVKEELLDHIFDLHVTTRHGIGRGRGLYVAKQTISANGGELFCRNRKSKRGFHIGFDLPKNQSE